MPITRALTARQASSSSSPSSSSSQPKSDSSFVKPVALGGSSRTLRRSNSSSSLTSVQTSHSVASSNPSSSSSSSSSAPNAILAQTSRRGLPRTCSAPNPFTTTGSTPTSASPIRTRSSQPSSTKRTPNATATSQSLSRSSSLRSFSSSSSVSGRSFSTASDSEDEEPSQPPTPPGGGPWNPHALGSGPDDSNKENAAPLWRSLEDADLMSEASLEQSERLERRRGARGSLRYTRARHSSPGAVSVASSSGAMTVASAPPRTTAPRSFIPRDRLSFSHAPAGPSTEQLDGASTVTSARKRRRQPTDADEDAENAGPSTRSAISRLRMARSQKTSVAATAAVVSPSRASQPMLSNATEGEDYMSSSQGTTSTTCDTLDSTMFDGPATRSRSHSSTPATSAPSTPAAASEGRKGMDLVESSSHDDDDIDSEPESELEADVDADAETVRGVDIVAPTVGPSSAPSVARRRFTNVYAHAKALLRYGGSNSSSSPSSSSSSQDQAMGDGAELSIAVESQIVGRVEERAFLQRFLHQRFGIFGHLESSAAPAADGSVGSSSSTSSLEASGPGCAGALYISGLPGTGKTALVRSVVDDVKSAQLGPREPLVAFINCVGLTSPREIFSKVLRALEGGEERQPEEAERTLAQVVAKSDKRILIVLDEMDHLLRSRASQNMLYKLFAFAASSSPIVPSSPSSHGTCALIGVANSLDLTQRFVPLLASKGAEPAVLHFRAFEAKEINAIVRTRLAGLRSRYDVPEEEEEEEDEMMIDSEDPMSKPPPILGAAALELASKKIAGGTGDLRKALDACRLAIDMVETEQRRRTVALAVDAAAAAAVAATGDEADPTSAKQPAATTTTTTTTLKKGSRDVLSHLTPHSAPKVSPSHILKVLSAVLGSPQLTKVRNLGLHAKLVLLGFVVAKKRSEAGLGLLGSNSSSNVYSNASNAKAPHARQAPTVTVAASIKLQDVFSTYTSMLRLDGEVFGPLGQSELLEIVDGLEVHGLVSLVSASSSGGSKRGGGVGNGGTANGLAGGMNRSMALQMPIEEVLRGLTTPGPASAGVFGATPPTTTSSSCKAGSTSTSTSTGSAGPTIVLSSLLRMWDNEERRIERSKGWHKRVEEARQVRQEELGGGRGAVGSF